MARNAISPTTTNQKHISNLFHPEPQVSNYNALEASFYREYSQFGKLVGINVKKILARLKATSDHRKDHEILTEITGHADMIAKIFFVA